MRAVGLAAHAAALCVFLSLLIVAAARASDEELP